MKKILTREQEAKKTRRNQLIIGIILVGLMLLSTAGYAITNNAGNTNSVSQTDYHGVTFVKNGDYWNFNFKNQNFITQYNPEEVKDINAPIQTNLQDYSSKPLYFVTESGQVEMELVTNLKNSVLRIQNACISEKNCENNLPIKNCSVDNAIIFKEAINETNSISQDKKCVFITADYSNLTKYEDAFLFKVLEI